MAKYNKKHGLYKHDLYSRWAKIKARCNTVYKNKNIKVCDEWSNSFEAFYQWAINNGYKENLTIDRINNNDGYKPSNCRWVNMKTQANNRSNNHLITYDNKTLTLSQWSNILNIKSSTLRRRLKVGWSLDKALNNKKYVNQYI